MRKIDILNHVMPRKFFERIGDYKDIGKRMREVPMRHDLDEGLRVMDRFPDYVQILSAGMPPIEALAGPDKSPELARICNDGMAELCQAHPRRFPSFIASTRLIGFAAILIVLGPAACGTVPETADPASDAPEGQRLRVAFKDAASYQQALQVWRTPEDVNAWIGAKFHYDMSRAMALSESERGRSGRLPIHQAREFFANPSGICVDLSRFAVETLREIDPDLKASYLMIEFSPVTIGGNTLRMHWLASFKRDGKYYFFADSKRPGHISGPYASAREFIAGYSAYRNRPVVAFRELDSYQRKQRTTAPKLNRELPKPDHVEG